MQTPNKPAPDWRDRGNNTNPAGPGDGEQVKNMLLSRSGGDPDVAAAAWDPVDAAVNAADAAAAAPNNNGRIGGKKTKKRAVRRKQTYKKSKKSYKKSKKSYKNKRSVKRGGASVPIIFKIIKGNVENPLFEVKLNPDQTGKDLYDRVNEQLDQNPAYLTEDEKAGARKLYTDNEVEVKYEDTLSVFKSPTTILLLINHRPRVAGNDELDRRFANVLNTP